MSENSYSAFDEIVFRASDLFLVSAENILSKKRERSRIVPARQAVCLVLRRQGMSMPKIAKAIGYADHSTVLHACAQAEEKERTDARYRDRIAALTRRCAIIGGELQHTIPQAYREEYRRLRLMKKVPAAEATAAIRQQYAADMALDKPKAKVAKSACNKSPARSIRSSSAAKDRAMDSPEYTESRINAILGRLTKRASVCWDGEIVGSEDPATFFILDRDGDPTRLTVIDDGRSFVLREYCADRVYRAHGEARKFSQIADLICGAVSEKTA